jgi:hypothetical protein
VLGAKYLQEANLSAQILQITRAKELLQKLRSASISEVNFNEHLMDWDELRLFEASLVKLNDDPSSDVTGNKAVLMVISIILHPPPQDFTGPCIAKHEPCSVYTGSDLLSKDVWGSPIRGLAAMDFLAPAFITYAAPSSILIGVKTIGRMFRHERFASTIKRLDEEQRCVVQSCDIN